MAQYCQEFFIGKILQRALPKPIGLILEIVGLDEASQLQ